jgi:hypothetical protein
MNGKINRSVVKRRIKDQENPVQPSRKLELRNGNLRMIGWTKP